MPNSTSGTSSSSTSGTSPCTVTTCLKSPAGPGARQNRRAFARRSPSMSEAADLSASPREHDVMDSEATTAGASPELPERYGCGPLRFAGTTHALYDRHLLFDRVVGPTEVTMRERYEAVAHSTRDILSQRWVNTRQTYERKNPKRVYYLSMEFLMGRCLANNITNLLLDRFVPQLTKGEALDWLGVLEQEPDAGLGNGGLGRLAACFIDSMATMQLPAMGYGLRYE